ncbi:hypothetical protein CAAN1_11S03466 [[Candida] anglica]|uniref:Striatin N-terminal domain-containing protein n=1 Tax=[Candida] anglica TaxID=148631 RepID=A0ABP0EJI3_9ASCO
MSNGVHTNGSSKPMHSQVQGPGSSQGQQQGGPQSGIQPPPQQQQPANYTLPGIINYLTSEFTNLERFKIVNNLEKSEMKHKINQLQGELNAIKYIEERQRYQIMLLNNENELLKRSLREKSNGLETELDTSHTGVSETSQPPDLPEIDLSVVKKSREQLSKAMKEVVYLLRTPSPNGYNYLNLPDPTTGVAEGQNLSNQYDELFSTPIPNEEDSELQQQSIGSETSIKESLEESKRINHSGISKYFDDSDTTRSNSKFTNPESVDEFMANDLFGEVAKLESKTIGNTTDRIKNMTIDEESIPEDLYSGANESEADTIIYDNDDDEDDDDDGGFGFNSKDKLNQSNVDVGSSEKHSTRSDSRYGHIVSTISPGYTLFRVFQGNDDGNLLSYVNYNHKSGPGVVLLRIYDTILKKNIVSTEIDLPETVSHILSIYHVFQASGVNQLIIVYTNGNIASVKVTSDSKSTHNYILNLHGKVHSTAFTEFTQKSEISKRYYGLTFTLHGAHKQLRVCEISADINEVNLYEIGIHKYSYFTNLLEENSDSEEFEAVHWYYNNSLKHLSGVDTPPVNSATHKSKNKSNGKKEHLLDQSIQPYEVILQVSGYLMKMNMISKNVEKFEFKTSPKLENELGLLYSGHYALCTGKGGVDIFDIGQWKIIPGNHMLNNESVINLVALVKRGQLKIINIGTTGIVTIIDPSSKSKTPLKSLNGKLIRSGNTLVVVDETSFEVLDV